MSSPAPSSVYEPSTPGTPSRYSYTSSPSPSPTPSSRSSSPSTSPSPQKVPSFPPLSLSSLTVAQAPSLGDAYNKDFCLTNPFLPVIVESAHQALLNPNANRQDILKEYIKTIEPLHEEAEYLLQAAMNDSTMRDLIIERYAENQVIAHGKARLEGPIDFTPMQNEISTLLVQSPNTTIAGEDLAKVLMVQIETYSFLSPRASSYKIRKGALNSLVLLGEGILGAQGELKKGIMGQKALGGKLALAIQKVLKELGGMDWECKGREKGYLKREGIWRRICELVAGWNAESGDELGMGRISWDKVLA